MSLKVPVLFQFYNRLDTTVRVFEEIRKQKPLYLYIVQDGYQHNYQVEEADYMNVRNKILEMIDWECNVHTLFRKINFGPGAGTADALLWFFKQVEYGIVLEHDCLPHPDFFEYCSTLLELYNEDTKIKLINGSNYQMDEKFGKASYYFGASGQLWGWAGWRKTFLNYKFNVKEINLTLLKEDIKSTFKTRRLQEYWINTYNWILNGAVDTWDYQLMYTIWHEKGLIILPNVNLVTNIGFGEQSIHCKDKLSALAESKTENILPIKHPRRVKRSFKSDIVYYDKYLSHFPIERISLIVYLKRKLKKYITAFVHIAFRRHSHFWK